MNRSALSLMMLLIAAPAGAEALFVKAVDRFPVEVPDLFVSAPMMVEFDDSKPESAACKNSDELLASIDRVAFSLRARYWASRIARGESRGDGFNAVLASIRSRYQRRKLDVEVRELSTSPFVRPLDAEERRSLQEFEWESKRLKQLCGLISAAAARPDGGSRRAASAR